MSNHLVEIYFDAPHAEGGYFSFDVEELSVKACSIINGVILSMESSDANGSRVRILSGLEVNELALRLVRFQPDKMEETSIAIDNKSVHSYMEPKPVIVETQNKKRSLFSKLFFSK